MSLLLFFSPAAPASATSNTGWLGQFSRPVIRTAMAAAVLATTLPVYLPRVPDKEFQDGWRSQFSTPPVHLRAQRSVALLGGVTTMPPRVADKEFQDGWRSKHQEPVPRAPRSVDLLGNVTGMPARVPEKEFQDGWRSSFSTPPAHLQPLRTVDLRSHITDMPPRVPEKEFQDGWRNKFQEPVPRLPRSLSLLGQTVLVRVPDVEYQDGWRSRFTDPPKLAARSIDLLGNITKLPPRVPDVEYQDGWRSRFPDRAPAAQRAQMLGQTVWSARVADVEYQDGWRSRFTDPPKLAPRSVQLLGSAVTARVPDVEYQDGWRQEFSKPVRLTHQARLEGYVAWPGFGYSITGTATPSELARIQWGDPPKAPARSVALLGQTVWAARVPDVQYQDGWRNKWPEPPKAAARSIKLLGTDAVFPYQTPSAGTVTTEMWHNRWPTPPKTAKRSIDLLGKIALTRVPDVEYVSGWFAQWEDPPAYDIDVQLYLTDEYGDPLYDESGNLIQTEEEEAAYRIPPQRCVDLLGSITHVPPEPAGFAGPDTSSAVVVGFLQVRGSFSLVVENRVVEPFTLRVAPHAFDLKVRHLRVPSA